MNLDSLQTFLERIGLVLMLERAVAVYLPGFLKFIAVLIAGYFITRTLARLAGKLAVRLELDELSERVGVLAILTRLGLGAPSVLCPRILRLLGWAATLYLLADILHIDALTRAIGSLIGFIPTLLTALAMVLAGLLGAEFVKNLLTSLLSGEEGMSDVIDVLPRGVYVLILVLTFAMAAQQLGLDISLINRIILLSVVGVSIGLVGTVGLGCVPILKQLVARYHALRLFELDDLIEFEGHQARIVRFAPMVVILEVAGETLAQNERLFIPYHLLICAPVVRARRTHRADVRDSALP